ncbi:hypothetical protein Trydic_g18415, partial [Trypoxylus dichotomus]
RRNNAQDRPGVCTHDGLDSAAFSGIETATPLTTANKPLVFDFLSYSSKTGPGKTDCVGTSSENPLSAIQGSTTGKIGGICGDFKTRTMQKMEQEQIVDITHDSNAFSLDFSPKSNSSRHCDGNTDIQAQFGYGFGKSSTGSSNQSPTGSFDFGIATSPANLFSSSTVPKSSIAQWPQPLFAPLQSSNLFEQPSKPFTFGINDANQSKNGVATTIGTTTPPLILVITIQNSFDVGLFASPYITTITTSFGQTTQQSLLTSTNFGTSSRPTVVFTTQITSVINSQPIFTCIQKPNLSETPLFGQSAIRYNQQKDKNPIFVFGSNTPDTSNTLTNPTGAVTQSNLSIVKPQHNTFGTNTFESIKQKPSPPATELFRFTSVSSSFQQRKTVPKSESEGNEDKTPTSYNTFNAPRGDTTFGTNQISQTPFGLPQKPQTFGTNQNLQQTVGANRTSQQTFGIDQLAPQLFNKQNFGKTQTSQSAFGMNQISQPFGTNQIQQQPFVSYQPSFGIKQTTGTSQITSSLGTMQETLETNQVTFGTNQIPHKPFAKNQILQSLFGNKPTPTSFGTKQSPQFGTGKGVQQPFGIGAPTLQNFAPTAQSSIIDRQIPFGQSPTKLETQREALTQAVTFCKPATCIKSTFSASTGSVFSVISNLKQSKPNTFGQATTAPLPNHFNAKPQNQEFTFDKTNTQFGEQAQNSKNIPKGNGNTKTTSTVFGQNIDILGQPQRQSLACQPASVMGAAQYIMQPPKTVAAATPLITKMRLFQLSERDTTFGEICDDGRSLDINFSLRKPIKHRSNRKHTSNTSRDEQVLSELDEHRPLRKPLPPPPRSSKITPLKPLLLRKPSREGRSTSRDLLLPSTAVKLQRDRSCKTIQCCNLGDAATSVENLDYCGITLNRRGYYTIPPLKELAKLKREYGQVFVKGFTVGRIGYGNVCFPDRFDVANFNLDQIVHFQYREVVIYPDESIKPPVGQGLNRRAQVTIDSVYPKERHSRKLITDNTSLQTMDFVGNLKNLCRKNGTKFIDYKPETGSWVFMVEHFSKYTFTEPLTAEENARRRREFAKQQEAAKKQR